MYMYVHYIYSFGLMSNILVGGRKVCLWNNGLVVQNDQTSSF